MTAHLLIPYSWEKCPDEAGCRKLVHVNVSLEELRELPQEWVMGLLGNCRVDDTSIQLVDADGLTHCDGWPAVEWANGTFEWFQHGVRHREDGPAVEFRYGARHWYYNGELHRDDGPAVIHADGAREIWRNGEFISQDYKFGVHLLRYDNSHHSNITSDPVALNEDPESYSHDLSEYF